MIVTGIPTTDNVKIEKPSNAYSNNMPWTTRFVDVPSKVIVPPKIVAYDDGIKNLKGEMPCSSHQFLMIGVKVTTIGVLFRDADNIEIGIEQRTIDTESLR